MADSSAKLSVLEKIGYSAADAAANFVFMTMVLFQANFYTDAFFATDSGEQLSEEAKLAIPAIAANIVFFARIWDAFFDPLMGILADRTQTRWGKFRPWIIATAVPWGVFMFLAYMTPDGWSTNSKIVYALITNTLLMTIYSCNNMPYAALGGVMTGDVNERAKLNSYRFVAVNIAQFIVGGFTLVLVSKFAGPEQDSARGWQITMGVFAVLCVVLFLITFFTTRERIQPPPKQKTSPKQDFADLFRNGPWRIMFFMTLCHFTILPLRGAAYYNFYTYCVDRPAMYEVLDKLGLTAPALPDPPQGSKTRTTEQIEDWKKAHPESPAPDGFLGGTLGYVVYADKADLGKSNVAGVAFSLISMLGTATTIIVILGSPFLSRKFGKKAIAVAGFGLVTVNQACYYLLGPKDVGWMIALTIIGPIFYAPTIALVWAMFADVVDFSEWKSGRRATGMIFATIGFALKAGLSLGTFMFLKLLAAYGYKANEVQTDATKNGIQLCASIYPAILFAICTALLIAYPITKHMTIQIADELMERRKKYNA